MLALTPVPLQTAGERALFGELARWDTGASVRAAVVASIPLSRRGPGRRISDAILFVPEGIAVIRIVEVLRQTGAVTALPEGPWTIAPKAGSQPGAAAVRRRVHAAGRADAGRHGHRDEAPPGRARARPDRAADRPRRRRDGARAPRTATSARVTRSRCWSRARCCSGSPAPAGTPASTTPGSGRRPTCGPRSRRWAWRVVGRRSRSSTARASRTRPYVLRRPELLTPAAMAASPNAVAAAPAAAPAPAPVREQPSPAAIAQAVAASAAAAHRGRRDAPSDPRATCPAPARHGRHRRTAGAPSRTPAASAGCSRTPTRSRPRRRGPPSSRPPRSRSPRLPPPASRPPRPFAYWTESGQTADPEAGSDEPGSGRRIALLAVLALLVVAGLGVVGWMVLAGDDGTRGAARPRERRSAQPTVPALRRVTCRTVDGVRSPSRR